MPRSPLFIAVATFFLIGWGGNPSDSPLQVSGHSGQLQLSLNVPKAEYVVGEMVQVTMILRNVSPGPVALRPSTLRPFDFAVYDDSGQQIGTWAGGRGSAAQGDSVRGMFCFQVLHQGFSCQPEEEGAAEVHPHSCVEQTIADRVWRADPVVDNADQLRACTQADDGQDEDESRRSRGTHGRRHQVLNDRSRWAEPESAKHGGW